MPLITCPDCNKEISDSADNCPNCGRPMNTINMNANQPTNKDQANSGLNIISFLIPLVGIIVYLAEANSNPIKAKSAGKAALWGVLVYIILVAISSSSE